MNKVKKKIKPDLGFCKTCTAGSCCYEGAEMSIRELRKIVKFDPPVPNPWFRLVKKSEELDEKYPFSTLMLNGTCLFQDGNNRCQIYAVRPKSCRDFPLEKRKAALYFERLCVLLKDEWPNNSIKRTYLRRERNPQMKKK